MKNLKWLWLNTKYWFISLFTFIKDPLEANIPDDLGAKWRGPFEADPRDYKAEHVLGAPTEDELKQLPEYVDLLKKYNNDYYVNQGHLNSCTCSSGHNILTQQLAGKVKNDKIKPEQCYVRQKMGHGCTPPDTGDYLETVWKVVSKNGYKVNIDDRDEFHNIKRYSYANTTRSNIKYYLSKGYLLHFAFRGNRNTWIEMSKGEIKTTNYTPTGGHAIAIYGYDSKYVYIMNSWTPNDGDKYPESYAIFRISWDNLDIMLKKGLANWRFWVIELEEEYLPNNDDNMLFEDYKGEPGTEQYEAVKFMKDNGIVKGENGKLFPGRPLTRLEMVVILYRIIKKFIK